MGAHQLSGSAAAGVILVYHGIAPGEPVCGRAGRYWITPKALRQHLAWLRATDISTASLESFWTGQASGGGRHVVVTFDDGRRSDYEKAWPLLAAAKISASFFLNPATVGTAGYVTWAQAHEMRRFGMSIESHSNRHVYLTRLSRTRLRDELRSSKEIIEDRVGSRVDFLAAPYGEINRRVREAAIETGYRAVLSGSAGIARPGGLVAPRVCVYANTALSAFRRLVQGNSWTYLCRTVRAATLYLPKRVFIRLHAAPLEASGVPA